MMEKACFYKDTIEWRVDAMERNKEEPLVPWQLKLDSLSFNEGLRDNQINKMVCFHGHMLWARLLPGGLSGKGTVW